MFYTVIVNEEVNVIIVFLSAVISGVWCTNNNFQRLDRPGFDFQEQYNDDPNWNRFLNNPNSLYVISGKGDRRFEGIGGISGGGATSKLLKNYPLKERSDILDYLFKPGFGASLQILKVEIGGDSQSTDGVESSHMHFEGDANYHRGYEWWLMKEAKKRNPLIQLYGLPWVFPGWLAGGNMSPYYNRTALVHYVVSWVEGALKHHNLNIDFIGIWNERPYDVQYIKMLRKGLNQAGFGAIQIVAADSASWKIVSDISTDRDLSNAVSKIGIHYPDDMKIPPEVITAPQPRWASEEFSVQNTDDLSNGGCWARILNEDFLMGNFTAFIAWNLVGSYYDALPYADSSLMTANQPWSGHYSVNSPIWITAHHTQFYSPGWEYLPPGQGSGSLTGNGTMVTLVSPKNKDITIVIETMDPRDAPCFYPKPKYTVQESQSLTLCFSGIWKHLSELHIWRSILDFKYKNRTVLFQKKPSIKIRNRCLSILLRKNEVITMTTIRGGKKGAHSPPPPAGQFPTKYQDSFESYAEYSEPYNFAQQAGVFEIRPSGDLDHGKVMQQVVPQPPIDTCLPRHMPRPITLIGDYSRSNVAMAIDTFVPHPPRGASGVFIAARVDRGGCDVMYSNGVYCWLSVLKQTLTLSANHTRSKIYSVEPAPVAYSTWYSLELSVKGDVIKCSVTSYNTTLGAINITLKLMPSSHGFVAVGTDNFASVMFDNFHMNYLDTDEKSKPMD